MVQPLRVGIIGCGVIAPSHIESYRLLDGVEVVWLCDIELDKAKALAQQYDVPNVTADYQQVMAADVDAVSVCTDHASHSPITIAALQAGKHVLCEKALTSDREKLDAMIAEHEKHPHLVFSGVFQHRFDLVMQYLKQLVEQKAFGTLLTASVHVRCLRTAEYYKQHAWRGTWAEEGGAVLINQAIHFVDALAWITGGVHSLAGCYENMEHQGVIEAEDTAVAALKFRSGALGTLEATSCSHLDWEYTLSLHGAVGSIEVRNDKPLKICFADAALQETVAEELASRNRERVIDAGANHYGFGHPAQVADFVGAIREHRLPFVEAASARHAADIAFAIYKSSREQRWVVV